jgi:transcriptional regulator
MHVPAAYSVTDRDELYEFIRAHSFAVLASANNLSDQPPIATHLPLLLKTGDSEPARLLGHVARGNPQWGQSQDRQVLAIFSGPHAYISAGWYGEKNVVPTWNYVAVHVTGRLRIIQDAKNTLALVRETTEFFEQHSLQPWSVDSTDRDFLSRLVEGIVGFTIEIEGIQGCWKLNQHHSESRRRGVIAGLNDRGRGDDNEIARLMKEADR